MKLAVGTRLGPYEIQNAVGAGGMGVVYRADDARLGRKVAIKILPHADSEHLKRFEREARMIGGLNHPNLLTLYDIGEHDGTPFLVTELLEGESLSERLARGRLRIREAIQIGAEVARGLAAAHDAGVVHRDIKPANIFLTTDGRTKILDFGIAKLQRTTDVDQKPERDVALAPTATTDTGMMIGTPGYMAPEQLEGDEVDGRTDIFALGVVLYEMISGVRAFASESAIEESYAILKNTPDPPAGATKAIARVVLRCLEKRPEARFQSATDLAFALDELDASTDPVARISASELETAPKSRPDLAGRRAARRRRWIAVAAIGTGIAAAGASGLVVGRHTVTTTEGLVPRWPTVVEGGPAYRRVTYHSQTRWNARLARDGKSALYSRYRDGREQVERSQITPPSIVPVNVDGRLLDISVRGELAVVVEPVPDAGGTLSRVFEGSGPRALAERVTSATWLPDGESLAIIRDGSAIEFPIGTVIVQRASSRLDMLRASPAGDRFAFVDHPSHDDTAGKVVVVDRSGKQLAASTDQVGVEGLAWSPDGTEVWFSNSSTIYGVDLQGRERVVLNGAPGRLALVDVVGSSILVAPTDIRLKMFTGPRGGPYREVSWFDSSEVHSMSSDGSAIAFVEGAGTGLTSEGYAQFFRRGDQRPSLFSHGYTLALVPDGSAAIVAGGPHKLTRVPTGIGTPTPISLGSIDKLDIGDRIAVAWQGRYAIVRGAEARGVMKLWRVDLEHPSSPPTPIAAAHEGGRHAVSPDGSLVAIMREAGGIELVSVTGGPSVSLEGPIGELPVSFTGDGAGLFVTHVAGDTIEIDRIDLARRARESWLRIVPEQRPVYYAVALDATGEHVTYSTNSDASDLYVLEPPASRARR
ncbi:MAG TPA: protein kinase [Kofleriaceae bacterium]|nr:protein kinase [Kofleriaceae bacterium]